jgi:hypothetical protein
LETSTVRVTVADAPAPRVSELASREATPLMSDPVESGLKGVLTSRSSTERLNVLGVVPRFVTTIEFDRIPAS